MSKRYNLVDEKNEELKRENEKLKAQLRQVTQVNSEQQPRKKGDFP